MDFVSLHHHSTFSFGDGYGLPAQHVARVAELGGTALALTEHGNTSSHVQLEKSALAAGIKPIFGCELYTTAKPQTRKKWHLTVLAENAVGYRNLMRLVSKAWSDGFYYSPTVSGEMLREHAEGLIVLSGCADSMLACKLLGGKTVPLHEDNPDFKAARKTARKFQELFGENYYLEVQAFPELARSCKLNAAYARIGRELGIGLAATCDVHYPLPEHNEMQKILHAALRPGTGTVAAAEAQWEYNIRLTLPKSDDVLLQRLEATGLNHFDARRALSTTAMIAERTSVQLPKAEPPRYPTDDAKALIREWLNDGWAYRVARNPRMQKFPREYTKRVKYEMSIIEAKDFISYFLMLSDVVRYAKSIGIPVGPARGSAAASLVCYLLRITEVDPLQYPMVFERFIDTTRADLPDVDLDFADDRRDEIRQYLIGKYGEDHVGNIGNFTRYRAKNSINDVARVHKIPRSEIVPVTSRIDNTTLSDTIKVYPQAKAVFDKHPELLSAMALEGNYRGMSVHAAGIVVSTLPITDITAVYQREVGTDKRIVDVLATDKYDASYLGLLKADILGLRTLSIIAETLRLTGMTLEDLYAIPLDDAKTMNAFRKADVVGVFQYEGRATRMLCRDVRPDNFMQLSDVNALSRPGPLFSGAAAAYIEAKHDRKKIRRLHPIVDKYTESTFGQIIYQEQVLNVVRDMGGFPVEMVGFIRKVISQKTGEDQFNLVFKDFERGAKRLHGIEPELASKVWKLMVTSSEYSFNIAHTISYAMIGFWTQYLKQYHPTEFYAANLAHIPGDKNNQPKIARLIKDAERHGVRGRGPSLEHLTANWTMIPGEDAVRAGLIQIPGIGPKMVESILTGGPYENWSDLGKLKGIGKKKIAMITEYADNADPFGIARKERILAQVRKVAVRGNTKGLLAPNVTSEELLKGGGNLARVVWVGFISDRHYYVAEAEPGMERPDLLTSAVLRGNDDGEEDVTLRFSRYDFPRFKNALDQITENDVVIVAGRRRASTLGAVIAVEALQVFDSGEWDR